MPSLYTYTKFYVLYAVVHMVVSQTGTCDDDEIQEGQEQADNIWTLSWQGSGNSCASLLMTKESTLTATPYDNTCEADAYRKQIDVHYEAQKETCDLADGDSTDRNEAMCLCDVMVNNLCTTATFAEAVQGANFEDVIGLTKSVEVVAPIIISTTLTIVGLSCGDSQGTLIAAFPKSGEATLPEVAILYTQEYVSITLDSLIFKRKEPGPDNYGIALYAEKGIGLDVIRSGFVGLRSPAKGASAIYIHMAADSVLIDSDSYFTGNSVSDAGCVEPYCIAPWDGPDQHLCPDECFGGGGAVWLNSCYGSTKVSIAARFNNNYLEFGHGMGGAIFMDWIECPVTITGTYENNTASDGGAIHIESLQSSAKLNVTATFTANHAVDGGWGGRGAAVRVRDITAKTQCGIYGVYEKNTVENGRGAMIATNNVLGRLTVDAIARNNLCDGRGGLISNLYEFTGADAKLTMKDTCVFTNNTASTDKTVVLNFEQQDIEMSEEQWRQQVGDYEVSGQDYPAEQ